ncbi:hypothetical protein Pint_28374 [Pistacia integerrima]|uniref:Uncharacterized protein n=1 Tax=Pistacia integerrima TaxID=434235 RepID=A0ACC0YTW7_9ROSI|nr:hypothetical protein Pint_28374 [Pistacia integerrima]
MGFGVLRSIIGPLSRTLVPRAACHFCYVAGILLLFVLETRLTMRIEWPISMVPNFAPLSQLNRHTISKAKTRPYAWVQHTPGQPISPSNPNEGSVKRRNEKKRMRLRRAFILAEAKKRKAQLQEANRKKRIKRVERKMAAVARERAWAERLAELQRLEKEKKKSMA